MIKDYYFTSENGAAYRFYVSMAGRKCILLSPPIVGRCDYSIMVNNKVWWGNDIPPKDLENYINRVLSLMAFV
jgi:hypothetical protein